MNKTNLLSYYPKQEFQFRSRNISLINLWQSIVAKISQKYIRGFHKTDRYKVFKRLIYLDDSICRSCQLILNRNFNGAQGYVC